MRLKIQKWGHSAAIRLPSAMLTQVGAKVGDTLNADVSANALTLRVAKPRYKLADLLAEMPAKTPRLERWDDMPPVGREIW